MGLLWRTLAIVALLLAAGFTVVIASADTVLFRSRFTLTDPQPAAPGDFFGVSLGVGDVNADGVPDIVAPRKTNAYVFSGMTGQVLLRLVPPGDDVNLAWSSVAIGDLAGDGTPDIVIGSDSSNCFHAGRAYVFSGRTGEFLFSLDSPNASCDPADASLFGASVTLTQSGDGRGQDIVVGAPGESVGSTPGAGRVYVFSGQSRQMLRTLTAPDPTPQGGFGANLRAICRESHCDLAVAGVLSEHAYVFSPDGLDVELSNPRPELPYFGSTALDVALDARGNPIVAVGAFSLTQNDFVSGSATWVFSEGSLRPIASPNPADKDSFGLSAAFVYPRGSERPYLVVGAPDTSVSGQPHSGSAYVFDLRGRLRQTLTAASPSPYAGFGFLVASARGACSSTLAISAPNPLNPTIGVFTAADQLSAGSTCHLSEPTGQ